MAIIFEHILHESSHRSTIRIALASCFMDCSPLCMQKHITGYFKEMLSALTTYSVRLGKDSLVRLYTSFRMLKEDLIQQNNWHMPDLIELHLQYLIVYGQ